MWWISIIGIIISCWIRSRYKASQLVNKELMQMTRDDFDKVFWQRVDLHIEYTKSHADLPIERLKFQPVQMIELAEELDDLGFEVYDDDFKGDGTLGNLCEKVWQRTLDRLCEREPI